LNPEILVECGKEFLLDNQERYQLNCEYDNDAEQIYIQLSDKFTGEETVFDASDILKQVFFWIVRNEKINS